MKKVILTLLTFAILLIMSMPAFAASPENQEYSNLGEIQESREYKMPLEAILDSGFYTREDVLSHGIIAGEDILESGIAWKNVRYYIVRSADGLAGVFYYQQSEDGEPERSHGINYTYLQKAVIIDGVPEIGEEAFKYNNFIKSINVPSSVTKIGYRAFYTTVIEKVTGMTGVVEIGDEAFYSSRVLTQIDLPKVKTIGKYAFFACDSLATINGMSEVVEINRGAFEDAMSLTQIDLPKVTTLGSFAFDGCDSLQKVVLGAEGLSIGDNAFLGCSSLSTITLPKKISTIGEAAFESCINLSSIVIPEGITEIPFQCFQHCSNLSSIKLPSSLVEIGGAAFYACDNLKTIVIPEGVKRISGSSFKECRKLDTISIPSSLVSIAGGAFMDCDSLSSITIPETVTTIGDRAFGYETVKPWEYKKKTGFIIYGYSGTEAQNYANKWEIPFVNLNGSPIDDELALPYSSSRTLTYGMSGEDVSTVQRKLKVFGFYSGELTGTYDAATEAAVTMFQAANGLKAVDGKVGAWTTGALNAPKLYEPLSAGTTGNAVSVMQSRLISLGYLTGSADGSFGPGTETALKLFQSKNNLPETGIADQATLQKLYNREATANVATGIVYNRTLAKGMSGQDVLLVQKKLAELGYLIATPDGSYGAMTEAAVILFQSQNGLEAVDGKVGKWTVEKLNLKTPVYAHSEVYGSNGIDVKVLQKRLKALGYLSATPDGSYGRQTELAVKNFQTANGLSANGQADVKTLLKVFNSSAVANQTTSDISQLVLTRTLAYGMKGDDVLAVQKKLVSLGFLSATPDGTYGAMTEASVIMFQAANGLEGVDGKVGNWTTGVLNSQSKVSFVKLAKGSAGTAVKVMQKYLKTLGYLTATPDGIFGAKSAEAVKEFQRVNGLPVTGEADRATLEKLYNRNAKRR